MIVRACFVVLLSSLVVGHVFSQEEHAAEERQWSGSAGVRYLNRFTSYGVDLSGDRPAIAPSLSLSHAGGFSAGLESIVTTGSGGGLQRWSLGLGYDLALSEALSLSAEFTHYGYQNDTANVLAGLSNSLSVSAELDLDLVSISVSLDQYLGNGGATYFGADVSSFVQMGSWSIVPMVQTTFVSQTVSVSRTKQRSGPGSPRKGSGGGLATTTITGLSSMSLHVVALYGLGESLSLVLHPSILYSPLSEISSRSLQFVWSAGIRYSVDF